MSILLPVPADGFPETVLPLCARTAHSLSASVHVLAVVDREGIGRTGAGAHPGSIHLAEEAVRSVEEREGRGAELRVEAAVEALVAEGVRADGEVRQGNPRDEISVEAARFDLLLTSIGSHYAFRDADRPGALVLHLVKERLLPVLLAGSASAEVRTVAIGCDGGEHSVRAVGALSRLGLWKDGRILLAASNASPEECERRVSSARAILSEAGYGRLETHHLAPPKLESFPALCERERVDAVVLGGWGERRWDDLLGLSLTGEVLRDGRWHAFLFM